MPPWSSRYISPNEMAEELIKLTRVMKKVLEKDAEDEHTKPSITGPSNYHYRALKRRQDDTS